MEKNLYRGYILVAHKMGKTPVEIFNELSLAYSDAAPCYMTVCRWVVRFSEGIEDLKDFDRPGRPITAVTPSNISAVQRLIQEDIHISYDRIVAQLSLSKGSIHEIIHGHLKLKKITSRWVPYVLNDDQKKNVSSFAWRIWKDLIPESGAFAILSLLMSLGYILELLVISNRTWLGLAKVSHLQLSKNVTGTSLNRCSRYFLNQQVWC